MGCVNINPQVGDAKGFMVTKTQHRQTNRVACRAREPDDADPAEAVHPAVSVLLKEIGESGRGGRDLRRVLQLLLDARQPDWNARNGRQGGESSVVD